MALTISSPAFDPGGPIPQRYTCDGGDVSPSLAWAGVLAGVRSLALAVVDPDAPDPEAPRMTWVHGVVDNLPPATGGLAQAAAELPVGAACGINDWKRAHYGGPCPPVGRHRYFHGLYALDRELPDIGTPGDSELERAMRGHLLEQAELIGTYQR